MGDIFPEWFTQPDTLFKTVLWLFSPVYVWLVKKIWTKGKEWNASSSERAAKAHLILLRKALDNPPTLLESVAYLVCGLPFPIASLSIIGTLYFSPYYSTPAYPLTPQTAELVTRIVFFLVFFVNYVFFGVLTIYGIQVAYRLRHGQAQYIDNYKKGIQNKIDQVTSKFPKLLA